MNKFSGDIDIDVKDRASLLANLNHIGASQITKGCMVAHNVGIYVQEIPFSPIENRATFEYNKVEKLGYQKIDILNNYIYQNFNSEEEIYSAVNTEPKWELFEDPEIVSSLAQLSKHALLVNRLKPKSVEDLAMILAIIRPSKSHLQQECWSVIRREVWKKDVDDEYVFKRSHSIAYAVSIIAQLSSMFKTS